MSVRFAVGFYGFNYSLLSFVSNTFFFLRFFMLLITRSLYSAIRTESKEIELTLIILLTNHTPLTDLQHMSEFS